MNLIVVDSKAQTIFDKSYQIKSQTMPNKDRILEYRATWYPFISLDNREGCKLQMLALCDEARLQHLALV